MKSDRPTLSQVQIIQSLAEALSWLEKEVCWGVSPAELNHLTGRIGELYAAMITRGQMALDVNQRGYDVVSASNERISVKTVTTSNHVSFNQSTFHQVDRIMVLRVNIDDEKGVSVEELLDIAAHDAQTLMRSRDSKFIYSIFRGNREERPVEDLEITGSASYADLKIVQYESGAIRICRNGEVQPVVVKEVLRPIAIEVGVDLFNSKGGLKEHSAARNGCHSCAERQEQPSGGSRQATPSAP